MLAGVSKIDITPDYPVFMDGMIRSGKSQGVHDRIFARALVVRGSETDASQSAIMISVEVCGLKADFSAPLRNEIAAQTGIPYENIIIAATHTHSGPAAMGIFNPAEQDYLDQLKERLTAAATEAVSSMRPATAGFGLGRETTISHYRRLLAKDGRVIMNWEEYSPDEIDAPLGVVDPDVAVVKIADAEDSCDTIAILFNHAGHPNVMSGDNYLISGDYTGHAMRALEERYGCVALFANGAQGTMDIDGRKDRDWTGVERAGNALADAVCETVESIELLEFPAVRVKQTRYEIPRRIISEHEKIWADNILIETGGRIGDMPDGVGDDYLALLFDRLSKKQAETITVEQTCILIGGCVFVSFPGELFTEIGMSIKEQSFFVNTFIMGLANGEIGYIPTERAIREGGYAVKTREAGDKAAGIIEEKSLELIASIYS